MCIHMQTFHDTYQYYYMIAPVVLVCIGTCIWYVLVCIYDRFSTQVWGEHRWYWYVLCTYFGMYLLVFSGCICVCHVFVCIKVFGIVAPNTY